MATHTFKIKTGSSTYKGTIVMQNSVMGSYVYDEDSDRPNSELDDSFSIIVSKVNDFLKTHQTLEKLEIKEIEV